MKFHRCETPGCRALVSDMLCARCQKAAQRRPAEYAFDSTAVFMGNHPEITLDFALFVGQEDARFVYGDGSTARPKGILS